MLMVPGKTAQKRSGESERTGEDCSTGQSSPKRSKQDDHNDLSFAEVSFDIDVVYQENKGKKKETLEKVIKHIAALLNSVGGVIRINESGNDETTIFKQRDGWLQALEKGLVAIIGQDQVNQCFHWRIVSKCPYLFVKKCKRICTQNNGLKIPLQCSVEDATYEDTLNILNRNSVEPHSESSSLEMSEEEDMEHDSGYPEDTPSSCADEKHAHFFYDSKVSFVESDTVQFKFIKDGKDTLKGLLKGIDNNLPKYVSAFANHLGGNVYFGIDNDGMVKGQVVAGEDEKTEVKKMVEKIMKRKNENQEMIRIWGKLDFDPQYDEHWSVEFVEVIGKAEGDERCVIVVNIKRFLGGMFLQHPLAWKVDGSSEKIIKMDFDEWKNRHTSDSDNQEMLKRFQCLTLDGIGKRVYQLKDMTTKFAKNVFPARERLKFVPENFAERFKVEQERDSIRNLQKILRRSYSDNKGFVMFDKSWSGNVGIGPSPDEVLCDMFVMSHSGMPRMITLARECSEKVKKYNLNLAKKLKSALINKGGCLECVGIDAQIILLNDINDGMILPSSNVSYPPAYNMNPQIFAKIREALVIILAGFKSSLFNPTVGVSFLYVLTTEQYNISIREDPYVVVSAPPGTGKTVVAMERIKRLQKRNVSKVEILYICANKSLASFLWSELGGMCIPITRAMFVSTIKQHGYGEFSNVRHVVVDEAQNFRNESGEDWFKSILTILNWPNNSQHYENTSLFIFCDQLQKIRRECCGLSTLDSNGERQMSSELFPAECRLSAVIRNSKKIYEQWEKIALAQPVFTQNNQLGIAHDYEGRDVSFVKLSGYGTTEIFSKVKETIDQLLHEKSYKASDVAVLFNTKDIAKQFREYLMLVKSDIRVTDAEVFPRKGNLVVDSFRRFSGLDAPVVVAVDPSPYRNYENEDKVKIFLYSRAMVEFYLIA